MNNVRDNNTRDNNIRGNSTGDDITRDGGIRDDGTRENGASDNTTNTTKRTNSSRIYGYARVSTREQHEDRQVSALKTFGVEDKRIYIDKQSGKDFKRPLYRKLMRNIKIGDTMVIKSIDRLGRNYDEIIEQWRYITKEKKVFIVVLDMPLLDTRMENDLLRAFIADLTLQILSFVAHQERDFIKQRQREGIAEARARGVRFGKPRKPDPDGLEAVCREWSEGKLSGRKAAKMLGMSESTFRRRAMEIEQARRKGD